MLQLIRAILKDPEDPTQCSLLFANQVGLLFAVLGHQSCVGWAWSCGTSGQRARCLFLPQGRGPSTPVRRTEHEAPFLLWPRGKKKKHLRNLTLRVKTLCLSFLCSVCHLCFFMLCD